MADSSSRISGSVLLLQQVVETLPQTLRSVIHAGRIYQVLEETELVILGAHIPREQKQKLLGDCRQIRTLCDAERLVHPEAVASFVEIARKTDVVGRSVVGTQKGADPFSSRIDRTALSTSIYWSKDYTDVLSKINPAELGLDEATFATLRESIPLLLRYVAQHLVRYEGESRSPPVFLLPFFDQSKGVWHLNTSGIFLRDKLLKEHPGGVFVPDEPKLRKLSSLVGMTVCSMLRNFQVAAATGCVMPQVLRQEVEDALSSPEGIHAHAGAIAPQLVDFALSIFLPNGSKDIPLALIAGKILDNVKVRAVGGLKGALAPQKPLAVPVQRAAEAIPGDVHHLDLQELPGGVPDEETLADLVTGGIFSLEDARRLDALLGESSFARSLPGFSALNEAFITGGIDRIPASEASMPYVLGRVVSSAIPGLLPRREALHIESSMQQLQAAGMENPQIIVQSVQSSLRATREILFRFNGGTVSPPSPFSPLFNRDINGIFRLNERGSIVALALGNEQAFDSLAAYASAVSLQLSINVCEKLRSGTLQFPPHILALENFEARAQAITAFLFETAQPNKLPMPPIFEGLSGLIPTLAAGPLASAIAHNVLPVIDAAILGLERPPVRHEIQQAVDDVRIMVEGHADQFPPEILSIEDPEGRVEHAARYLLDREVSLQGLPREEVLNSLQVALKSIVAPSFDFLAIPEVRQMGSGLARVALKHLIERVPTPKVTALEEKSLHDTATILTEYAIYNLRDSYTIEEGVPSALGAFYEKHAEGYRLSSTGQLMREMLLQDSGQLIQDMLLRTFSLGFARIRDRVQLSTLPSQLLDTSVPMPERGARVSQAMLDLLAEEGKLPLPPEFDQLNRGLYDLARGALAARLPEMLAQIDQAVAEVGRPSPDEEKAPSESAVWLRQRLQFPLCSLAVTLMPTLLAPNREALAALVSKEQDRAAAAGLHHPEHVHRAIGSVLRTAGEICSEYRNGKKTPPSPFQNLFSMDQDGQYVLNEVGAFLNILQEYPESVQAIEGYTSAVALHLGAVFFEKLRSGALVIPEDILEGENPQKRARRVAQFLLDTIELDSLPMPRALSEFGLKGIVSQLAAVPLATLIEQNVLPLIDEKKQALSQPAMPAAAPKAAEPSFDFLSVPGIQEVGADLSLAALEIFAERIPDPSLSASQKPAIHEAVHMLVEYATATLHPQYTLAEGVPEAFGAFYDQQGNEYRLNALGRVMQRALEQDNGQRAEQIFEKLLGAGFVQLDAKIKSREIAIPKELLDRGVSPQERGAKMGEAVLQLLSREGQLPLPRECAQLNEALYGLARTALAARLPEMVDKAIDDMGKPPVAKEEPIAEGMIALRQRLQQPLCTLAAGLLPDVLVPEGCLPELKQQIAENRARLQALQLEHPEGIEEAITGVLGETVSIIDQYDGKNVLPPKPFSALFSRSDEGVYHVNAIGGTLQYALMDGDARNAISSYVTAIALHVVASVCEKLSNNELRIPEAILSEEDPGKRAAAITTFLLESIDLQHIPLPPFAADLREPLTDLAGRFLESTVSKTLIPFIDANVHSLVEAKPAVEKAVAGEPSFDFLRLPAAQAVAYDVSKFVARNLVQHMPEVRAQDPLTQKAVGDLSECVVEYAASSLQDSYPAIDEVPQPFASFYETNPQDASVKLGSTGKIIRSLLEDRDLGLVNQIFGRAVVRIQDKLRAGQIQLPPELLDSKMDSRQRAEAASRFVVDLFADQGRLPLPEEFGALEPVIHRLATAALRANMPKMLQEVDKAVSGRQEAAPQERRISPAMEHLAAEAQGPLAMLASTLLPDLLSKDLEERSDAAIGRLRAAGMENPAAVAAAVDGVMETIELVSAFYDGKQAIPPAPFAALFSQDASGVYRLNAVGAALHAVMENGQAKEAVSRYMKATAFHLVAAVCEKLHEGAIHLPKDLLSGENPATRAAALTEFLLQTTDLEHMPLPPVLEGMRDVFNRMTKSVLSSTLTKIGIPLIDSKMQGLIEAASASAQPVAAPTYDPLSIPGVQVFAESISQVLIDNLLEHMPPIHENAETAAAVTAVAESITEYIDDVLVEHCPSQETIPSPFDALYDVQLDGSYELNTAGKVFKSVMESGGRGSRIVGRLLGVVFAQIHSRLERGEMVLPPELLDLRMPEGDRARAVSRFVVDLFVQEGRLPLPREFDELGGDVCRLAFEVLSSKLPEVLKKLDATVSRSRADVQVQAEKKQEPEVARLQAKVREPLSALVVQLIPDLLKRDEETHVRFEEIQQQAVAIGLHLESVQPAIDSLLSVAGSIFSEYDNGQRIPPSPFHYAFTKTDEGMYRINEFGALFQRIVMNSDAKQAVSGYLTAIAAHLATNFWERVRSGQLRIPAEIFEGASPQERSQKIAQFLLETTQLDSLPVPQILREIVATAGLSQLAVSPLAALIENNVLPLIDGVKPEHPPAVGPSFDFLALPELVQLGGDVSTVVLKGLEHSMPRRTISPLVDRAVDLIASELVEYADGALKESYPPEGRIPAPFSGLYDKQKDGSYRLSAAFRCVRPILSEKDVATGVLSKMLASSLSQILEKLQKGDIAFPPELLLADHPHRSEEACRFILALLMDEGSMPLPRELEPLRSGIHGIVSSALAQRMPVLLGAVDTAILGLGARASQEVGTGASSPELVALMSRLGEPLSALANELVPAVLPVQQFGLAIDRSCEVLRELRVKNPEATRQSIKGILDLMRKDLRMIDGHETEPSGPFSGMFMQDADGKYHRTMVGSFLLSILENPASAEALEVYMTAALLKGLETFLAELPQGLPLPEGLLFGENAERVADFSVHIAREIPLPPVLEPLRGLIPQMIRTPLIGVLRDQLPTLESMRERFIGEAEERVKPSSALVNTPGLIELGVDFSRAALEAIDWPEVEIPEWARPVLAQLVPEVFTYVREELSVVYTVDNPPKGPFKGFFEMRGGGYQLVPAGKYLRAILDEHGPVPRVAVRLCTSLFAHAFEMVRQGTIQVPPELFRRGASPERTKAVSEFLYTILFDPNQMPFPRQLEELRPSLCKVFSLFIEGRTPGLLENLDDVLYPPEHEEPSSPAMQRLKDGITPPICTLLTRMMPDLLPREKLLGYISRVHERLAEEFGIGDSNRVSGLMKNVMTIGRASFGRYEGKRVEPKGPFAVLFSRGDDGVYRRNRVGEFFSHILDDPEALERLQLYATAASLQLVTNLCDAVREGRKFPGGLVFGQNPEEVADFILREIIQRQLPIPAMLEPIREFIPDLIGAPLLGLLKEQLPTRESMRTRLVGTEVAEREIDSPAEEFFNIPGAMEFSGEISQVLLELMPWPEAQIPGEAKPLLHTVSESLFVYMQEELSVNYTLEHPPEGPFKNFFEEKDGRYQLDFSGRYLQSLFDPHGRLCPYMARVFESFFSHVLERARNGQITIPAELLQSDAPDRAKKVGDFVCQLLFDPRELPLPPQLEFMRPSLCEVLFLFAEGRAPAMLETLDENLMEIGALPKGDKEVKKSSPAMVHFKAAVMTPALKLGALIGGEYVQGVLSDEYLRPERDRLVRRLGFTQDALTFLQRTCTQLLNGITDEKVGILLRGGNKEKLAQLLEINILTFLANLCESPRGGFPEAALNALRDIQMAMGAPGGEAGDPSLRELAPIATLLFQRGLPEGLKGLELLFSREALGELNRMLAGVIEAKAGDVLQGMDANLENTIANFVDGVSQSTPEMSLMRRIFFQKLERRRRAVAMPKGISERLSQQAVGCVQAVFPEMRLPRFLLKKFIKRIVPYAGIPLAQVCNDLLESAHEAHVTLAVPSKKQEAEPVAGGPPPTPVRTPRELVRRLVGAKKREMRTEMANEGDIFRRFFLGVKLFLFSIVGFFLPYVLFGSDVANGLGMADRIRALARSLERSAVPKRRKTAVATFKSIST